MAEVETQVLEACSEQRDAEYLCQHLSVNMQSLMEVLNRLSEQGKLQFYGGDGNLTFKRTDENSRHNEMDSFEERLVYQHVEEAKNKGIWTKHLRQQTGIERMQFNRVIKKMESKKLIKSVLSVAATKRKFYMLYELEPDASLTGGAWYSGQDFDAEFIRLMSQAVFQYVKQRAEQARQEQSARPLKRLRTSLVTAADVHAHIKSIQLSREELNRRDVLSLLHVLVYDGSLEAIPTSSAMGAAVKTEVPNVESDSAEDDVNSMSFRYKEKPMTTLGLLAAPCGPVGDDDN